MDNVVSLKDHRMANPKEAVLDLKGMRVTISSPDKRLTYLNKTVNDMFEFNDIVGNWKKQHPKCNCIDF
jgi:hypothetical protein